LKDEDVGLQLQERIDFQLLRQEKLEKKKKNRKKKKKKDEMADVSVDDLLWITL